MSDETSPYLEAAKHEVETLRHLLTALTPLLVMVNTSLTSLEQLLEQAHANSRS